MRKNLKLYSKYFIILFFVAAFVASFFFQVAPEVRARVCPYSDWQMVGISAIATAIITPILELIEACKHR